MRVFITGVSSGIGRELARHLIAAGHEVRGVARRAEALDSLRDELGAAFSSDVCDIGNTEDNTALRARMREEGYLPDVVVLNAALDLEDEGPGISVDNSLAMMRVNVDGAQFWVAAFVEHFLERGSGQFVGISSMFAQWPDPASASYSASKAALSMLLRGLRLRYDGRGVRFKLLYLGPVATAINPRFAEQDDSGSLVVASAPATAAYIARILDSGRENFYYPLYVHAVFLFLRWLPDRLFQALTAPFKR